MHKLHNKTEENKAASDDDESDDDDDDPDPPDFQPNQAATPSNEPYEFSYKLLRKLASNLINMCYPLRGPPKPNRKPRLVNRNDYFGGGPEK